jgi:hypothetical protein
VVDAPPSTSQDIPPPTGSLPSSVAASHLALSVDTTQNRHAVSPFIFGVNQARDGVASTLVRAGGNRYTAYNWENNASNAGIDYNNMSDAYLGGGSTPGEAVATRVRSAHERGASALITVPMLDFVAADKSGAISQVATAGASHWKKNRSTKPGALAAIPDTQDDSVYQDEFVAWAESNFASARASGKQLFYNLDNEPGLWPSSHPLVHPSAPTYAEMKMRSVEFATMIKTRAPNALVFGAVAYGFNEYENLQEAADAAGRNYLAFYLSEIKAASDAAGKRLVDVLDLHWYPEVRVNGTKIIDNYAATPSDAMVDARLQAPRSLWDPTYKEASWIANYYNAPIKLLSRLTETIAANNPGTLLSFSEYNYGGGNHISGGLSEVDVLGVFARESVFAANYWELQLDNDANNAFVYAAINFYRNYDGKNSQVGELSVQALSGDNAKVSAFAFATAASKRVWIVAVNKTRSAVALDVSVAHDTVMSKAQLITLTSAAAQPVVQGSYSTGGNSFTFDAPPLSATLIALAP